MASGDEAASEDFAVDVDLAPFDDFFVDDVLDAFVTSGAAELRLDSSALDANFFFAAVVFEDEPLEPRLPSSGVVGAASKVKSGSGIPDSSVAAPLLDDEVCLAGRLASWDAVSPTYTTFFSTRENDDETGLSKPGGTTGGYSLRVAATARTTGISRPAECSGFTASPLWVMPSSNALWNCARRSTANSRAVPLRVSNLSSAL